MTTDEEFTARREEVEALTGPGARFETEVVQVHGVARRNYVRRAESLAAMFTKSVEQNGGAVAIVDGDRSVTFDELNQSALRIGADLALRDVVKGDRIGILGANSIEWIEAFWACAIGGFVSVPLNGLWSRDELSYAIEHSEMSHCFVDEKRLEVVDGLLDPMAFIRFGTETRSPREWTPEPLEERDGLSLFYTSGTTGRPKGAVIDHRGIIANLQNLVYFTIRSRILRATPRRPPGSHRNQSVSLLAIPLFHVTGCHASMVVSLVFGNQVVLYPPQAFDPDLAMELIGRHRVTTFVGVPTLMSRILDSPSFGDFDMSSLTTVGFGGAPVSPDLARRTREGLGHLESFSNGYGLTETNAAVIGNYGVEYERRPDSVGKPAPNVDVSIVDEQGQPVQTGYRGEILIGGPMLMVGYWRDPEATAAAIRNGWFHTGDVGIIDEDGYISVVDRIKDVVIRGGENVYSAEVEHVLESHRDVVEAAVVGIPHRDLGEEVKAVVVVRPRLDQANLDQAGLDEAELSEYCRTRIASFKVPTLWEFRDDPLPRNAAGKVRKPELRGPSSMAGSIHSWFAWVAIVMTGLSGLIALGYHFAKRSVDGFFKTLVAGSILALSFQVALGLIAFGQDLEPGSIHMFYGIVIVLTLVFIYIYRIQFEQRPALYWGLALLFMMGLGIRGVINFGQSF